jgi:diacylglycerol kinase
MDKQTSPRSSGLAAAVSYAVDGIVESLCAERNMKIHFGASIGLVLFFLVVRPPLGLVTLGLFVMTLVLAAELMNSAVERTVDLHTGGEYQQLAKMAKDAAAGSVFVMSVGAVVVGGYLLSVTYPWRWLLWTDRHILAGAESLTALVILLVVILRAYLTCKTHSTERRRR